MTGSKRKPPSVWSCFAYDGIDPYELHCTHVYFGRIDEEDVEHLKKILLFHVSNHSSFEIDFSSETYFSGRRVLLPGRRVSFHELLSTLRLSLQAFVSPDVERRYIMYRPHVTTDKYTQVKAPFTRYCLIVGGTIVLEIPLTLSLRQKFRKCFYSKNFNRGIK